MKPELYRKIYKALNEDLNMILSDDDFEEPEIDLGIHISNLLKNVLFDGILKKCEEQDAKGLKELINSWDGHTHILFATDKNIKDVVKFSIKALGNKANLNWIDTSNVTDMSCMFQDKGNLSEEDSTFNFNGDISKWDVSNVTNMSCMFFGSVFNKDISKWDVSNVTNMNSMFACSDFNRDISGWDVSNVTDMNGMFEYSKFNSDISKWNVSKVTSMACMFSASKFNSDISKWDVSNVTNMYTMFEWGKFNRDISEWDVSNVTRKEGMFDGCPIKEKYKPNFNK